MINPDFKVIYRNTTPFMIDANLKLYDDKLIIEFYKVRRIFFIKLKRFICGWGKSQGLK